MATRKTKKTTTGAKQTKLGQTPAERTRINRKLVKEVERLLKPLPLEVIGHIDSMATCCRNGTVALVKVNADEVINPPLKAARMPAKKTAKKAAKKTRK